MRISNEETNMTTKTLYGQTDTVCRASVIEDVTIRSFPGCDVAAEVDTEFCGWLDLIEPANNEFNRKGVAIRKSVMICNTKKLCVKVAGLPCYDEIFSKNTVVGYLVSISSIHTFKLLMTNRQISQPWSPWQNCHLFCYHI